MNNIIRRIDMSNEQVAAQQEDLAMAPLMHHNVSDIAKAPIQSAFDPSQITAKAEVDKILEETKKPEVKVDKISAIRVEQSIVVHTPKTNVKKDLVPRTTLGVEWSNLMQTKDLQETCFFMKITSYMHEKEKRRMVTM
jgi:hypothetical protein